MSKGFCLASLLSFVICYLLFVNTALANSKIVSVTIDNPDEALENVVLVFYVPFNLEPINLTEGMKWDASSRELEISAGFFAPNESRVVNFYLDGQIGAYLVTGRLLGNWQSDGELFEGSIDPFTVVIGVAAPAAERAEINLPELIKDVAVTVSAVLGTVTAGTLLGNAFSASSYLVSEIANLLSYLGFGIFLSKKRKPWGRVYNQLTNKPISGAIVKLLDTGFKRVKETQMTDKNGRFGFLAAPGSYYVKAGYRGFEDRQSEEIKIADPNQLVSLDLSLISLRAEINQSRLKWKKITQAIGKALNAFSLQMLILGSIFSVLAIVAAASLFNYIILGAYGVLWMVRIGLSRHHTRSFGKTVDRAKGRTLPLTVVRLFSAENSWLLGTRVSDSLGRYNFLINPGSYYITAVHDGYELFQSLPVEFTKANLLAMDIRLGRL